MSPRTRRASLLFAVAVALSLALPATTVAHHPWGSYHWSTSSIPLQLTFGEDVSAGWDGHLDEALSDWDHGASTTPWRDVLSLSQTSVNLKSRCPATTGRVNVCNARYGFNGWLGVTRIWTDGPHITKATVRFNDSYFDSSVYGSPAWKQSVMCHEIGHTFGLGHVDEDFDNPPSGSCLDYSSDPGPNQEPYGHDYEQLDLIYDHVEAATGGGSDPKPGKGNGRKNRQGVDQSSWGRLVAASASGRESKFQLDLGGGKKITTYVIWAQPR